MKAFTLVESVFATLLVGVLLVATLNAAGASARLQTHSADWGRGEMLAQSLMNEILAQYYVDPGSSPTFGPEAGEVTTPPSRTNFNDVDDYNGWSESPPQNKDGSVIPNFSGWSRNVSVAWINVSNSCNGSTSPTPFVTDSNDTGVKRITVTVTHNNAVVATWTAIKANYPASSDQ
jgi:hypothetical protein